MRAAPNSADWLERPSFVWTICLDAVVLGTTGTNASMKGANRDGRLRYVARLAAARGLLYLGACHGMNG